VAEYTQWSSTSLTADYTAASMVVTDSSGTTPCTISFSRTPMPTPYVPTSAAYPIGVRRLLAAGAVALAAAAV